MSSMMMARQIEDYFNKSTRDNYAYYCEQSSCRKKCRQALRILQGYQYVAANPDEVCPANWTWRKNNVRGS